MLVIPSVSALNSTEALHQFVTIENCSLTGLISRLFLPISSCIFQLCSYSQTFLYFEGMQYFYPKMWIFLPLAETNSQDEKIS